MDNLSDIGFPGTVHLVNPKHKEINNQECFETVGHINGDVDLAVVNRDSDNISILKNTGNAAFSTAVNYGVGNAPNSIFASDLDGDGDDDLAVTDNGDIVFVLMNE